MSKLWPNSMGEFVFIVRKESLLLSNDGKFIFNWTGNESKLAFICGLSVIGGVLLLENHIRVGDEFGWKATQVLVIIILLSAIDFPKTIFLLIRI